MDKKQVYRNEWKYLLSYPEAELLRRRLEEFMRYDSHAKDGTYMIRSLYFDDWKNTAYEQKLMGIYERQKWRIRVYNCSDSVIALERKKKKGNYIHKDSVKITREEYDRIINGDFGFLLQKPEQLCKEFYVECVSNVLRPKVIVDYDRTPLVLDEGTVRITFDSGVRAAIGGFDIFDPDLPTLPAIDPDKLILEVKYTEFLPRLIGNIITTNGNEFTSFSKYVACYDAAHHLTNSTLGINKSLAEWKESL